MKKKLLTVTIGWWVGIYLVFDLNFSFQVMAGIGMGLLCLTILAYTAPE